MAFQENCDCGVPHAVQEAIVKHVYGNLNAGELCHVASDSEAGISATSRFCQRLENVVAFSERIQEMFCGTDTSTPFCARLAQAVSAAKALRDTFCGSPVPTAARLTK